MKLNRAFDVTYEPNGGTSRTASHVATEVGQEVDVDAARGAESVGVRPQWWQVQ
jgi:hypothetical protein